MMREILKCRWLKIENGRYYVCTKGYVPDCGCWPLENEDCDECSSEFKKLHCYFRCPGYTCGGE